MKNRQYKIKQYIKNKDIDCIIAFSPENFHYVTGSASHQHTVSRNPSFACSIISSDANEKTDVICMDFEHSTLSEKLKDCIVHKYDTWVGVRKYENIVNKDTSKENNKIKTSLDVLSEILESKKLINASIGIELDFISYNFYKTLLTRFPNVKFTNVSEDFMYLRSIKDKNEIRIFKKLTRVADEALNYAKDFIEIGVSEQYIANKYREYCISQGVMPSSWSMFSTGSNAARLSIPTNRIIESGDTFKYDGGVNAEFDFYTTDNARTWLIGDADNVLIELKQRLFSAQRKMIDSVKIGLPMSELFKIGFDFVKEKYPCYKRGHLGHSISSGPQTADFPMITAHETRLLEEGMILSVEVPCYIENVGGFNIEDMILVTKEGAEILTHRTPHFLSNEKRINK